MRCASGHRVTAFAEPFPIPFGVPENLLIFGERRKCEPLSFAAQTLLGEPFPTKKPAKLLLFSDIHKYFRIFL